MSDPEAEYRGARRRFVRRRLRGRMPYGVAIGAAVLLNSALDGASLRALAVQALVAVLGLPVLYLPLVLVFARLEWRFVPNAERLAAERARGTRGRVWFDPPAT